MEDFQIIDNCLMVRLPEEVDHHKSTYICEKADSYILREEVENVVFDFEETRFMDSSGIGIIMGRYKKIACFGGKVFAIHADPQIRRILLIAPKVPFYDKPRFSSLLSLLDIALADEKLSKTLI